MKRFAFSGTSITLNNNERLDINNIVGIIMLRMQKYVLCSLIWKIYLNDFENTKRAERSCIIFINESVLVTVVQSLIIIN